MVANAITEDENEITMRDANASRERPRLESYDFDEEDFKVIEQGNEEFSFNADVSRLMDIIINSLYQNKEVFIREIISNASDALDKLRFVTVQNPEYLGELKEFEIKIDFDYDAKTISITDTGIGMTKAELIKNLGTVAKSGTTAFLEAMGKGDNMSMIGQFGVGFYSAFLVANKVQVTSKSNDDKQHVWTSTADAKFFVVEDPRGDTLTRGTRVTLFLKDDAVEFVEQDKIKNLVKKYSEFINYPIYIYLSKEIRKEVEDDEAAAEAQAQSEIEQEEGFEIQEEEEGAEKEAPKKTTKTITEQVWEWELINEVKAIWLRDRTEITEQEYFDFYKTITKDHENPIGYTHFSAEGEIEFKSILFVPGHAPYDLFENYYGKSSALKLYVRRVLITEEFEELMPRYLNFVKGVVDSDDLPLNVSREQLQQLKMIKVMSKKLVRKTIEMLRKIAEDEDEDEDEWDEYEEGEFEEYTEDDGDEFDEPEEASAPSEEGESNEASKYDLLWTNFGKNIKLGVIEDASNRSKLAKLLRFYSTHNPEKLISLDEYISRMKTDQDTIYYLPGDSKDQILKSPILKIYQKRGYEVLLMGDPIDEFCV